MRMWAGDRGGIERVWRASGGGACACAGGRSSTGRHPFTHSSARAPLYHRPQNSQLTPRCAASRARGRSPAREGGAREGGAAQPVCVNPILLRGNPYPGRLLTRGVRMSPRFATTHRERGADAVRTCGACGRHARSSCLERARVLRGRRCRRKRTRGPIGTRRAKEGANELAAERRWSRSPAVHGHRLCGVCGCG